MTKAKFLTLLQERICMLDDEEQKDILDEYAQHIDMKIENGMTEAEAIEDFGPIDELAAEVLSAYHVKPLAVSDSVSADIDDLKESGHNLAAATVSITKKSCSKVGKAVSGLFAKLAAAWRKAWKELADWHPLKGRFKGAAGKVAKGGGSLLGDLKNGSISLGKFCVGLCLTLVRWCWNAFVACFVAALFLGGLCAVFGLGVCMVLTLQGYPLGGVTVALLGTALVSGSLGLLMLKLIRRKVKDEVLRESDGYPGSGLTTGQAQEFQPQDQGEGAGCVRTISRTQPIPVSDFGFTRPLC